MERKSVYFLGIGGIGMSALARYFLHEGYRVAGYDRTRTALTDALTAEADAIAAEAARLETEVLEIVERKIG